MKAAALRGALSDRARHDRVHVVESIATGDLPSAKDAKALFAALTERKNLLVVLARADIVSMKSVRNLENVHVLAVDQLNTYDVLCADDVVFTKAAFDTFVGGGQAVVETTPVVVEDEAPAEKAPKATKAAKADKPAKAAKTAKADASADEADKAEKPAKKAAAKKTAAAKADSEDDK
jgi:large subunit ribosomal protein L4